MWNNRLTPIYIVCVVASVIAFNMPRFFEYRIVAYEHVYVDDNNVTHSEQRLKETRTDFGSTDSYRLFYKVYLVNFLLVLIPIVLLITFTILILVALQRTRRRVRRNAPPRPETTALNGEPAASKAQRQKDAKSKRRGSTQEITLLLVLVVVVAIICQAPLCVFHFVRYKGNDCGHIVLYLDTVSKLLVNVNSSINFIIYCLFSPKFRKLLMSSFTCMKPGHRTGLTADAAYTSFWGVRATMLLTARTASKRARADVTRSRVKADSSPTSSGGAKDTLKRETNGNCHMQASSSSRNVNSQCCDVIANTAAISARDAASSRSKVATVATATVEGSSTTASEPGFYSNDQYTNNSTSLIELSKETAGSSHSPNISGNSIVTFEQQSAQVDSEMASQEPPATFAKNSLFEMMKFPAAENLNANTDTRYDLISDERPVESCKNGSRRDDGFGCFLASASDADKRQDESLPDYTEPRAGPQTPTLPKDFPDFIVPLKETVC